MGAPDGIEAVDHERTGCQFSVYPLGQLDVGPAVEDAIAAAATAGVSVRVQNLSTLLVGDEEQVFTALRAAFRAAREHGPAVMVATFTARVPSDATVARIQETRTVGAETAPGKGSTAS